MWFATFGTTWCTVIANLIGGLIFFWIDRWIFRNTSLLGELWEVRSNQKCYDCQKQCERVYRLVKFGKYDRMGDKSPQFRCHDCSRTKYGKMFRGNDIGGGGEVGAAARN